MNFIAKKLLIKENTNPTIKYNGEIASITGVSINSTITPPSIIGKLHTKENAVISSLFTLFNSPVEMVIPDLETPGRTAKPCEMPTKIDVL